VLSTHTLPAIAMRRDDPSQLVPDQVMTLMFEERGWISAGAGAGNGVAETEKMPARERPKAERSSSSNVRGRVEGLM